MPVTPAVFELWYSGVWNEVPVYTRDPIAITRGRDGETPSTPPASTEFTIGDRAGDYNPANPESVLFGLAGRNTPARGSIRHAYDAFGRTVSSGWGTADSGDAWSTSGGSATDYSVGSGVGSLSLGTLNVPRYTVIDRSLADVEVYAKITAPVTATGGGIVGNLTARYTDPDNHYRLELNHDTSGNIDLQIWVRSGGVSTQLASASNVVTYTAGTATHARFQLLGTALRGRIWTDGDDEPTSWHVEVADSTFTTGDVGARATLSAANSNSLPVVVTFDDFEVRSYRFHGEAASWVPGRSTEPVAGTRGDSWVTVSVAGIRRRLARANADPLKSAHQRRLVDLCDAYWALDEGTGSVVGRLTAGAGSELRVYHLSGDNGVVEFGTGVTHPWLEKGVVLTGDVGLRGTCSITPTTTLGFTWITRGVTGSSQMLFTTASGLTTIASVSAFASLSEVDVSVLGASAVGSIDARAFTATAHIWYLELTEDGADVDWTLYLDNTASAFMSGTTTGVSLPELGQIIFTMANDDSATMVLGHVGVFTTLPSDVMVTFDGRSGETAADRFERLMTELGIGYSILGDTATSTRMGPQYPGTLAEQLADLETTDDAVILDAIDAAELVMQCGNYRYTKAAALTIDYALEELARPSDPVLDDKSVVNDVTVKRRDGADYRMVQETGQNNVQDPSADPQGVGRITGPGLTVNCEDDLNLPDHASWALHKGTVDKQRWPSVVVDMVATPGVRIVGEGDRIKIVNLPLTVAPEDADLLVTGTVEHVGPGTRKMEYLTEPYEPYKIASWAADSVAAADAQRRDTGGCETAASFTSGTSTSMSLTTTSGPLWSTDSDDYPFNIRVSGVVLTVTAMAGSSNPQTATITQTPVNGAVKVIPAGASVSLADPTYYGK